MNKKVIITFYLTYKCNLSCSYCWVYDNLSESILNKELFLWNWLNSFLDFFKWNSIEFEFFWWEPLLEKKFILDFFNSYKWRSSFKATTNWLLLDKSMLFLDEILLSVHYQTIDKIYLKIIKWDYDLFKDKISFTLVLDKYNIWNYYKLVNLMIEKWFLHLNILPVFWKYNRLKDDLLKLDNFIIFLINKWFNLDYFWYKNNKTDFEFSVDLIWDVYSFTWEYIYHPSLKDRFYVWNIKDFNYSNLLALNKKVWFLNSLSWLDNAKICNVYWWQDTNNFYLLNKYLELKATNKW